MKNLKPENYKMLFRNQARILCLHSEFFVDNPSFEIGNPLIIYQDGIWNSYINREREKICLQKGLELFQDKNNYQRYAESFREYIDQIKKEVIPKYKEVPQEMTKKEFVNLLPKLRRLWHLYGFTEFFYNDLAYQKMQETNNKIIKENLKDLEKLKLDGRKILNAFIYEGGIMHNVLSYISLKYLGSQYAAKYLYAHELLALFEGKKPRKGLIRERERCYAIAKIEGEFLIFSHRKALKLAAMFLDIPKTDVIEGVIAHKGTVRGKAFVIPQTNDMKKIRKMIPQMKKGVILVAQSTTPELIALCKKAGGIIADQGGMLSHAAIISRELNIPCLIGTEVATQILKTGDLVDLDANKGIVQIL